MRHLLALAAAVALAVFVAAAPEPATHASREAVLTFLRSEGIISEKTTVVRAEWDEKAHWWFVSVRHASGGITNWTVDADAKDYRFVCKN